MGSLLECLVVYLLCMSFKFFIALSMLSFSCWFPCLPPYPLFSLSTLSLHLCYWPLFPLFVCVSLPPTLLRSVPLTHPLLSFSCSLLSIFTFFAPLHSYFLTLFPSTFLLRFFLLRPSFSSLSYV